MISDADVTAAYVKDALRGLEARLARLEEKVPAWGPGVTAAPSPAPVSLCALCRGLHSAETPHSIDGLVEHLKEVRRDVENLGAGLLPRGVITLTEQSHDATFSATGRQETERPPRIADAANLAWEIACGRAHLFPVAEVEALAANLGHRLDCYVPPRECEAAVAEFAAALERAGWRFFPGGTDPENSRVRTASPYS